MVEGCLINMNADEVVKLRETSAQLPYTIKIELTRDLTPAEWLDGVLGDLDCKHRTAFVYALRSFLAIDPLDIFSNCQS